MAADDDWKTLADLGLDGWEHRKIAVSLTLRFKRRSTEHKWQVDFAVTEEVGRTCGKPKPISFHEVVFSGQLSYDGLRHLYMGDQRSGNFGYLHYPDIDDLTAALAAIRALELECCDGQQLHWRPMRQSTT